MGIVDWLFRRNREVAKTIHQRVAVTDHDFMSAPKTEFIDIPSRRFFGESIRSSNGRFTLAWRDANESGSEGGARSKGKGKYIVLAGKDVIAQGAVARPNDGKIANDGNFILNDWGFGGGLSEFTSHAMDLWAYQNGAKIDFSRPGKPTDNAFVESFNGTFRSECLNIHWFLDLKEARQLIEAWRREYNDSRPHASLDDRTPSEFASQIAASRDLAAT